MLKAPGFAGKQSMFSKADIESVEWFQRPCWRVRRHESVLETSGQLGTAHICWVGSPDMVQNCFVRYKKCAWAVIAQLIVECRETTAKNKSKQKDRKYEC